MRNLVKFWVSNHRENTLNEQFVKYTKVLPWKYIKNKLVRAMTQNIRRNVATNVGRCVANEYNKKVISEEQLNNAYGRLLYPSS